MSACPTRILKLFNELSKRIQDENVCVRIKQGHLMYNVTLALFENCSYMPN